jgi:lysozyme family protein
MLAEVPAEFGIMTQVPWWRIGVVTLCEWSF